MGPFPPFHRRLFWTRLNRDLAEQLARDIHTRLLFDLQQNTYRALRPLYEVINQELDHPTKNTL